jgi:hypothetical protein
MAISAVRLKFPAGENVLMSREIRSFAASDADAIGALVRQQGCQMFLDTKYQNGENATKYLKIYLESIYHYVQRQCCSRLERFSKEKKTFFAFKTH